MKNFTGNMDLIIGASGFIGSEIFNQLKAKEKPLKGTYYSSIKPELYKLNMISQEEVKLAFEKFKPRNTYMSAYIPNVDYCEMNDKPNEINELGVTNVVKMCKKFNSKLIFYSSDYIFDGVSGPYFETDTPNPINRYGQTKILCENLVAQLQNYLIIRTTVIYGYNPESKNFLMTLTKDLKNQIEKAIPNDQIGSPTYVKDLAEISIKLVEENKNGIYNVAGPDLCSRYVFALKIAHSFGLNENLIKPISTEQLKQPAKRPLRGGLIIDKIRIEINANPSGIDNVLDTIKRKINYEKF